MIINIIAIDFADDRTFITALWKWVKCRQVHNFFLNCHQCHLCPRCLWMNLLEVTGICSSITGLTDDTGDSLTRVKKKKPLLTQNVQEVAVAVRFNRTYSARAQHFVNWTSGMCFLWSLHGFPLRVWHFRRSIVNLENLVDLTRSQINST